MPPPPSGTAATTSDSSPVVATPPTVPTASPFAARPPATLPVPAQAGPSRPSLGGPSYSSRLGASPLAGGSGQSIGMGMSIDQKSFGKSYRQPSGGAPQGSYGARFYGTGHESPGFNFGTSVNMESSSFVNSSAGFGLPPPMSSSYRRSLSYAAAARSGTGTPQGGNPPNLSSSFASMSFQPMSMSFGGNSYSKSQVHSLMANRPRTDAELTETFFCCNTTHSGLHALLEHVEDVHPDSGMDQGGDIDPLTPGLGLGSGGMMPNGPAVPSQQIGFSPQVLAMDLELEPPEPSNLVTIEERGSGTGSQRSSMSPTTAPGLPSYPVPTSSSSSKPATPAESSHSSSPAPLQISDILTSPFAESLLASSRPPSNTALATGVNANANGAPGSGSTSSSPPDAASTHIATPSTSAHPSPVPSFAAPKVNPVNPARGFLGTLPRPPQSRFDRAFNEVVAGNREAERAAQEKDKPTAVAPGMLFASAVAGLGIPTQPPVPGQKPEVAKPEEGEQGKQPPAPGGAESTMPQPSLFTTHKPWRCPNPGCNKAYKQSNGLKYHQQKGQCDFAIHDAVDLGLTLEEAEERSRPFVCAVGAGCTKRYRQMNGLKYHYLNSGEHGKYGLRMLQNGTHPQPSGVPPLLKKPGAPGTPGGASTTGPTTGTPSAPASATSSPVSTPSRPAGAPYQIPSQLGQTRPGPGAAQGHALPRMGVFPTARPNGGAPGAGAVRTVPGAPPGSAARPVPLHAMNGRGIGIPNGIGVGAGQVGALHQGPMGAAASAAAAAARAPPPVQRGRDAVLFAAVETMDL